jgi:UDP:flavonoid glycosyltransferase YjiC (YdhE family)
MKILVAPLNWGLGHASRCVPLVQGFLDEGHEVILGGDGESLTLLRRHFPKLRYTYLAPLNLRYSKGSRQVWAMLRALPKLIWWALKDHAMLQAVLREESIDRVISDNRFGLYSKSTECIYVTHQLHIMLPKGWRWAETIASRLHARIYARFNKVWIPDYEEKERSLSGELGHPEMSDIRDQKSDVRYIGPLSRFKGYNDVRSGHEMVTETAVVLSGLEPQRTLLEQEIVSRYAGKDESVLIVQGLMHRPNTRIKRGNITLVPTMSDAELAKALLGAKHIIARSGYSTIMDLEALGLLKANGQQPTADIEFIPTPGQPEQVYLAHFMAQKCTSK